MEGYQKLTIAGKNIYVFEDHATALAAWADYRKQAIKKPNLITLDCHTDPHSGFIDYICAQSDYTSIPENIDEISIKKR